jgi:hypothetical protein
MDWTVIERMWTQAKGRIQRSGTNSRGTIWNSSREGVIGSKRRSDTSMAFPQTMSVKRLMIGSVGRCSSAHAVGASWADRGRH